MSSARGWFAKRAHPPGQKPTKDLAHSISTEKLPLPSSDSSKSPASFKFNTFAAVMGKKPKKPQPTLDIQDQSRSTNPHSPMVSNRPNTPRYTNRPPAKSISSTLHSGEDSAEPQTPSDLVKDRTSFPCSVMTLTDPDPFAAGAISIPQVIPDSHSLSFLSGPDVYAKKDESLPPVRRTSMVPSHHAGNSISSDHPRSLSTSKERKLLRTTPGQKSSDSNSVFEGDSFSSGLNCTPRPTLSKSDSSATLTDKKATESPMNPRLHTRSKADTEPALSRNTTAVSPPPRKASMSFSRQSTSLSFSSAPALTRKTSTSRLPSNPPTAPPLHGLPALPTSCRSSDDAEEEVLSPSGSGSSSSISFASSTSSTRDLDNDIYFQSQHGTIKGRPSTADYETAEVEKVRHHKESVHSSLADIFARSPVSTRRTSSTSHNLKKSVSHSTLQKVKVGHGITSPASMTVSSPAVDKELRKQRSFHKSRLQTSPAHSHRHHPNTPDHIDSTSPLPTEQRRVIASSPPVSMRKRLFSGSSNQRPSTGTSDDDLRSVFSDEVERGQSTVSLNPTSSSVDEGSASVTSGVASPSPIPDYAQRIMSPAEMLKVEAIVQSEFDAKYGEALRNRQRNISFTSASTPLMSGMAYTKEGPSAASFHRFSPDSSHGSSDTSSALRFGTRPSTAQDGIYSPHSSIYPMVGLPPPPRAQSRPHTAETTYSDMSSRRSSNVPFNPLSPPPPRRLSTRASLSSDKTPHKSMIRKPSFLEITDEAPSYEGPSYDGSFLDFDSGKESLDLPR